jgi:hypothetical protein
MLRTKPDYFADDEVADHFRQPCGQQLSHLLGKLCVVQDAVGEI